MALFLNFFKMKFDGFLDKPQHLFAGFPGGDTAWKIWNIGAKTGGAFFDDH